MIEGLPDDPTLFAIPAFFVLMLIEARVLHARYDRRDTWASLLVGLGSVVPVALLNIGVFLIATWLWQFRLVDLGTGIIGWSAAILAWDFSFYWQHRWEHEIRILWACHVNHHSSERYNLSTALRQPWTPWTHLVMYPGWALLGIRPSMILVAGGFDLIYQFWIHTESVDRLPRWFEFVFNTPSHHRVHHGSNQNYLDANYGGVLIIWDRMFGTFVPETEPVVYGLTKNIHTYSPVRIAFHEYGAVWHDVRTRSGRDRLRTIVRPPGWAPDQPTDHVLS